MYPNVLSNIPKCWSFVHIYYIHIRLVVYPFIERGQMADSHTFVRRNTDSCWFKFSYFTRISKKFMVYKASLTI